MCARGDFPEQVSYGGIGCMWLETDWFGWEPAIHACLASRKRLWRLIQWQNWHYANGSLTRAPCQTLQYRRTAKAFGTTSEAAAA